MKTSLKVSKIGLVKTPLLAVPLFGFSKNDIIVNSLNSATGSKLRRLAREEGFKGRKGQVLLMTGCGRLKAERLMLIGLGGEDLGNLAESIRAASARASRFVRAKGLRKFALCTPKIDGQDPGSVLRWLSEGAGLGIYKYSRALTKDRRPKPEPSQCLLVVPSDGQRGKIKIERSWRDEIGLAQHVVSGVNLARDLVNEPANELSPVALAERAKELASRQGIKAKVFGLREIERKGMHLLAAVAKGSSQEARLIHLHYRPAQKEIQGSLALVGKGITFDSGGLCLKPAASQPEMKSDMAGAAAVLGTMEAAVACQVPWELHAIVPTCENMPSATAYRPGDVFNSLAQKTVEIINTDAEGRLILADALTYATELGVEAIIDFATLTGACMVALGPYTAGLFSNDDGWADKIRECSIRAGEDYWRLPLTKALKEQLRSDVADLKNLGSRWGGAITAALFLSEFCAKSPWVHLDIAGPSFLNKPHGVHPKGGTGFGVLTMIELLSQRSPQQR